MSDPDTPALNADGTLKDASEMQWEYSPTPGNHATLPPDSPAGSDGNGGNTNVPHPRYSLKGKQPARRVASKRIAKPSKGFLASRDQTLKLTPKSHRFFSNNFIVGSDLFKNKTAGSSNEFSNTPKFSQGCKRATSAPPSPETTKRPRHRNSTKSKNESNDEDFDDASEEHSDGDEVNAEDKNEEEEDDEDAGGEDGYVQLQKDVESEGRRKVPRKHNHRGHDDRTRDVRAMYTKGSKQEDGNVINGNVCNICRANNKREADCFFTGGTSSLRKHISRNWKTHGTIYLEKCKSLDIEPVKAAMPAPASDDLESQEAPATQLGLDGFVKSVPKWSKEGLLEHIVDFVVSGDQAFQIVDREPFRKLLKYQRPAMKDSDIPHRTKLREEVVEKANVAIQRLTDHFKTIPGTISITFDAWTSKSYDPYLAVTAHYIDSPPDQPCEWKLQSKVLGFKQLKGRHNGANLATTTLEVLDQYEIRDKFGWATADNATANDKALHVLERKLDGDSYKKKWKARDRRVRCMEHTIYLAAGDFVKAVGPKTKSWNKTRTASVEDADADDESDEDNGDWMTDWNQLDDILDEGEEVDEFIDFTPGDALGKALALVNQIRASSQAKAYFTKCCLDEGIPALELIKWVRTRWGSMHDLVERLTSCKKAVRRFCFYADENLPKLKTKTYAEYQLKEEEWTVLGLIQEVLQEPRNAQASFSSETEPTVWKAIPIMECLQARWTILMNTSKFAPVRPAIQKGLDKLQKWHKNISNSDVYFTCLALNPGIKLEYCKRKWDKEAYDAGYKAFEKTFDAYYKAPKKSKPSINIVQTQSTDTVKAFHGYGSNFLISALSNSPSEQGTVNDPQKELHEYLDSPRDETVTNPIKWWGHHSQQYPILAQIARNYLAIQGSSVASERAFSSAGLTDDLRRNRIEGEVFGKVQILKFAYKTNFLNATDEAAAHEAFKHIEIE